MSKRTLTPWRRIKGGGTTTAKLLKVLKSMTSIWAKDMMRRPGFVLSKMFYETDLVILTPRDLGFKSVPSTARFMTKEFCVTWSAEHLDGQVIELCKPEDGPQLCIQYDNQPHGEVVSMAMERIVVTGGCPCIFYVERAGNQWLGGDYASADRGWDLAVRFVFRFRKVSGTRK